MHLPALENAAGKIAVLAAEYLNYLWIDFDHVDFGSAVVHRLKHSFAAAETDEQHYRLLYKFVRQGGSHLGNERYRFPRSIEPADGSRPVRVDVKCSLVRNARRRQQAQSRRMTKRYHLVFHH